jgi:hypothetical protein
MLLKKESDGTVWILSEANCGGASVVIALKGVVPVP